MKFGVSWLLSTKPFTNQPSMPTIGTKVMISKMRQERKRKPEIAMVAVLAAGANEAGW